MKMLRPRPRGPALGAAFALLAACDAAPAAPSPPAVPASHPCPAWALAPSDASLYDDLVADDVPAPLALALPLPLDLPTVVSQGNAQAPTHTGADAFAFDFAVPLDAPVRAAAPGVVVVVRDDSTRSGPDATYRGDANFVVVDHGGGLFTDYVHLAAGSARVAAGDRVEAGDVLASTGLSGQLTGPHLHFAVENVWGESLPARFVTPGGGDCALWPETDDVVAAEEADGADLIVFGAPSAMPRDAFAADGVTTLEGLPARLLAARKTYRVSGTADAPGATEVWLMLLPPEGGTARASWRFPLTSGAFSGALRVALPAGTYGLGAVAVAPGDPIAVAASVRISVE